MGTVHKQSRPYPVAYCVADYMGTLHKHSRPYPVADCVADNFTRVCDGWCLFSQCMRGCRQYSWRMGPQRTSPTPTPRPCLGKGLPLWMPLPSSPSPLRYRSTPISSPFFSSFSPTVWLRYSASCNAWGSQSTPTTPTRISSRFVVHPDHSWTWMKWRITKCRISGMMTDWLKLMLLLKMVG